MYLQRGWTAAHTGRLDTVFSVNPRKVHMKNVLNSRTVTALMAPMLLLVIAASPAEAANGRIVTVTGTSSTSVDNTEAHLVYTVSVVSPLASDAYSTVAAKVADIRRQLNDLKLTTAANTKTTSVSLRPEFVYDGPTPKLDGYRASFQTSHNVSADKAGLVLDSVVYIAGDLVSIDLVTFRPAKLLTLTKSLRKAAVADARETALELATAAGAKLGKVRTITVLSQPSFPRPPMYVAEMARTTGFDPGTEILEYSVTVTYELI